MGSTSAIKKTGSTLALALVLTAGAIGLTQKEAKAVAIGDVTAAMDAIITGADAAATAALPIGAAAIGIGVIGGILYKFIGR